MAGPNLYDLFFAEDGTSQAQALAEALRRRRGEGELVALTGSRKLAPFAQAQLQAAAQGDQQLAAAGQEAGGNRLRKALQVSQQQFQGSEGAKDRGLRRSLAEMELSGQMARAAAANKLAAQKQGLETKEGLRKEYLGNQSTKNAQKALEAYRNVMGSQPGGAGDIRLLYSYLHLVEPESVVKETEFATVGKSGGLPGQVQGAFNQLTAQGFLSDDVRRQIRSESDSLIRDRLGTHESVRKSFKGLATKAGVPEDEVAVDLGFDMGGVGASPSPQSQIPTITSDAEFDALPPGTEFMAPDGSRRRK